MTLCRRSSSPREARAPPSLEEREKAAAASVVGFFNSIAAPWPSPSGEGWVPSDRTILAQLVMINAPMSSLALAVEVDFSGKPAVDQTGLTARYDINLECKTRDNPAQGITTILNQLGLELVP